MTTREAFADATAGVCGSLAAMLAFYPIDVIKTNLQAQKSDGKTTTNNEDDKQEIIGGGCGTTTLKTNTSTTITEKKRMLSTTKTISIIQNFKKFARGLHYKTAHTVTSSFVYFFLYSWIQSQHRRYHIRKIRSSGRHGYGVNDKNLYKPSTSDRLLLSAIAAMINTLLTLPLDVLTARSQTETKRSSITEQPTIMRDDDSKLSAPSHHMPPPSEENKKMMDQAWSDVHNSGEMVDQYVNTEEGGDCLVHSKSYSSGKTYTVDETKVDSLQVGFDEKNDRYKNEDTDISLSSKPIFRIDSLLQLWKPSSLLPKRQTNLSSRSDLAGLWKGLWPSLLLCSNPSIHFTLFDIVKESVLKYKLAQRGQPQNIQIKSEEPSLSMGEAFIIGMIAKFAATIVTYPLIRAKVMLMVSKNTEKVPSNDEKEVSMVRLLQDTFANDGIVGLYKGCQLQLVHTLLKSALMMMARERISISTRRLILQKK